MAPHMSAPIKPWVLKKAQVERAIEQSSSARHYKPNWAMFPALRKVDSGEPTPMVVYFYDGQCKHMSLEEALRDKTKMVASFAAAAAHHLDA